jgi:hypothetical protein
MPDVTHMRIDQLDAVEGFLDGFTFRRAGAELGVTPFGMSIIDMPPETTAYQSTTTLRRDQGILLPTSSARRRSTSRCAGRPK